jgi:hypothetical protein
MTDEDFDEDFLTAEELRHEWHDHAPLKYHDEGVRGCAACEARWECP